MSSTLDVDVSQQRGVTVLKLKGDLDANTQKDFETEVGTVISGGENKLVFDMSGVTYMGSAGLRAFHAISNRLKEASGTMKLVKPSAPVGKVMKTLGFDAFFDIHEDLSSAIRSL